jgi:hypothetical protein
MTCGDTARRSVQVYLVHEGHSAQVCPHALTEQLKEHAQVQVPGREKVHLHR